VLIFSRALILRQHFAEYELTEYKDAISYANSAHKLKKAIFFSAEQ
jgi:hypothetical protein